MSINIEVFINNVSIKTYNFKEAETLIDVRKVLQIENLDNFRFLFNHKEIEIDEENNFL